MKKEIAVGYVRVSTKEQTLNYSLQFQQEKIKEFCQANNLHLSFIYDENYASGSTIDKRPVFREMMKTVLDSSEIKYIVVLADNRFSRDHVDAVSQVKKMHEKNKYLRLIDSNLNTEDPEHYTYFQLKSIISERHRKAILFHTKEGMRQRANDGLYNGGRVTGYRSKKSGLEIEESEETIILDIFEQFTKKKFGYKKIAQQLNEYGLKTITDEEWTVSAVKYILNNSLYIGKTKFEKVEKEGKHKPLIDRETWQEAQQIIAMRTTMPSTKRAGRNFLAGIIRCPDCKGPMVHHSQKKYAYYQCSRNKSGKKCKSNTIYKEQIEDAVIDYIADFIKSPLLLQLFTQKSLATSTQRGSELEKIIIEEQKNYKVIEKKIYKTYDLFYIDNNDFHQKQLKSLNNKLQTSVEKLGAYQKEYDELSNSNLKFTIHQNFRDIFQTLEPTKKKNLVKRFIKEIHIEKTDKIKERGVKKIIPQFSVDEFLELVTL